MDRSSKPPCESSNPTQLNYGTSPDRFQIGKFNWTNRFKRNDREPTHWTLREDFKYHPHFMGELYQDLHGGERYRHGVLSLRRFNWLWDLPAWRLGKCGTQKNPTVGGHHSHRCYQHPGSHQWRRKWTFTNVLAPTPNSLRIWSGQYQVEWEGHHVEHFPRDLGDDRKGPRLRSFKTRSLCSSRL